MYINRYCWNASDDVASKIRQALLLGAPVDALDLSGNRITGNGCNHLGKVLEDPVINKDASIVQLRDLDLSANNVDSGGCRMLGQAWPGGSCPPPHPAYF
jgi:Ran GTPase-activating protein (RanGAP) involved in mRNA processing and transport